MKFPRPASIECFNAQVNRNYYDINSESNHQRIKGQRQILPVFMRVEYSTRVGRLPGAVRLGFLLLPLVRSVPGYLFSLLLFSFFPSCQS